ncbi:hypothetical protein ABC977_14425 [Thioalkalicoccus limnaeus]|uniref:Uncharacterized protein n=1 Tax=Thioalkalicoccus limnaeus TaxID=120681 RepID=A0ABV4BJE0_9GAMM
METQETIQYASVGLGIFGIIIAFYQGIERRKLKQFMYSQAWNIYSISQRSFAHSQKALNLYKEQHKENLNPEVFEQLAKCEAHNVGLFVESIRQIQLSEPKFDIETIIRWKMQGRINDQTASFFIKEMPMKSPSIPAMTWQAMTLQLRRRLATARTGSGLAITHSRLTNRSSRPRAAASWANLKHGGARVGLPQRYVAS